MKNLANMKKSLFVFIAVAVSVYSKDAIGQGMAINSSGSRADTSAMLDVASTSKGMLAPRMTNSQRNAISTPATGLLIYQTDGTAGFYYYNGSAWTAVSSSGGSGSGWSLSGNSGTNPSTNFVGTTDNNALRFRVNNTWAGELNPTSGNVSFGYQSLLNNTSSSMTAVGYQSLQANTSGTSNTAMGYQSLNANTTGSYNTACGYVSLQYNTTGSSNTAFGEQGLENNTTGHDNTAVGLGALYGETTADFNTAIGSGALGLTTTGQWNTAAGGNVMYVNTTGSYNTAFGVNGLGENTTGSYNTSYGTNALLYNTTGSENTGFGYNAQVGSTGLSNATVIGYSATVNSSNAVVIGNTSVSSIGGYANWSNLSDGRFKKNIMENVPGLDFIMKLRPVTYTLDARNLERFQGRADSELQKQSDALDKAESIVRTGFVAQEVEKAAQQTGYDFSGIHKPSNDKDHYSLAYGEFTVPLVKAVQEQQKTITELQQQVAELMKKVQELESKK